jgi:hypothetical protein
VMRNWFLKVCWFFKRVASYRYAAGRTARPISAARATLMGAGVADFAARNVVGLVQVECS